MDFCVFDDIADSLLDEETGFFVEELEREAEEEVLLRGLWERPDEDAGDGVVAAEVGDVMRVVEVVVVGEVGEGKGVGYCCGGGIGGGVY